MRASLSFLCTDMLACARLRSTVRILLPVALVFSVALLSFAKDPAKLLAPHYREWLQRDVAYIITNEERDAFLLLPNDETRDLFIDRFWEVRNPTPGAPENAYKMEHYRRLEYANEFFGHASHTEGWRTDMGRIYITLGEPAQRQKLLGLQKITPMEIWFYQNANPALPPFFYIIFYQRDSTSEFRLYSPYSDGPEKLITAVAGPGRMQALKILSDDAGSDVARETLSLLTDEPVDMQTGSVSLQSDVMLGTIRNLANNPISKAELESHRQALEDVSHRIILGKEFLDVITVPLRDSVGNTNLHFVLRLKRPQDFTVGQAAKGPGYYYAILVSVKARTADGKLVLSQEKKISRDLTPDQLEDVKSKVFGYEGWLPLPPGKYKLEFQLTNLLSDNSFRSEEEVVIPEVQNKELQVSNLVPFDQASMIPPSAANALPFSGAGVKFTPLAGQELELVQGQALKFFYQVWDPSALGASRAGKKLDVDYAYGRMGTHDTQTIHDVIPMDQLDAGGSVINGKRVPTEKLSPGNYRLVMTLEDSTTQDKVYGTLNFTVYADASAPAAWDISDDNLAGSVTTGTAYYQRALCYQALGDKPQALNWFRQAVSRNPSDEHFRSKLTELYFSDQQYPEIVRLYARNGITPSTDEQTVLRIAESLEKTGDLGKAVAVLETATRLNPSSGPLLLGLAGYYRKTGQSDKAAAAEEKGKQFLSSTPPQS
jgi:GWxTD domain-containing protein